MRVKSSHAVVLGMALIVLSITGAGVLMLRGNQGTAANSFSGPGAALSEKASVLPSLAPSPTFSPPPSPTASPSRSPSPKPKPSRKPTTSPVPAPPPPPTEPSGCVPHYEGTNAPKDQVGAALKTAAARRFWTVSNVTLPENLLKAVAEQESGWQSAIVSCVGAFGATQVLPATGDWMNRRFETSYNVREVQGNAMLGSAYLQWLIKYFADSYFNGGQGDYALRTSDCSQDPAVADHREWCLLNAVIAAYNVGHGSVDKSATDDAPGYYTNHAYIENVRALIARF